MRRRMTGILASILDECDCLGVGVADVNGLVVQSAGEHGGHAPEAMAAALVRPPAPELEATTGDRFDEQVLVGERFLFVVRSMLDRRYIVYAMLASDRPAGPVRLALHEGIADLEAIVGGRLAAASDERVEEPRKFGRSSLIR